MKRGRDESKNNLLLPGLVFLRDVRGDSSPNREGFPLSTKIQSDRVTLESAGVRI